MASLGCWLGNPNDANCRAWFSGDPNIIANCEAYGTNPVKLALGMTEALFTREEMAASNVRGTRGKESLDPNKINSIRGSFLNYKFLYLPNQASSSIVFLSLFVIRYYAEMTEIFCC